MYRTHGRPPRRRLLGGRRGRALGGVTNVGGRGAALLLRRRRPPPAPPRAPRGENEERAKSPARLRAAGHQARAVAARRAAARGPQRRGSGGRVGAQPRSRRLRVDVPLVAAVDDRVASLLSTRISALIAASVASRRARVCTFRVRLRERVQTAAAVKARTRAPEPRWTRGGCPRPSRRRGRVPDTGEPSFSARLRAPASP